MKRNFIGSSDIPVILGESPFKTPLHLWAEKTGLVQPDDLSEVEAVEWGKRLERVVSKKFSEKNNVKLIAYKKRFIHKDYPFLSCELDNIISGTDEIVEIKTTNAWAHKDWAIPGEMPKHYISQVMFALGLSGRKVGHVAVLIGGQKYIEKRIDFDIELYNNMVKSAVDFWKSVQDKVEPIAVGGDNQFIAELKPESDEQIQAVEELNDAVGTLQTVKTGISDLIKQKNEIEAQLKQGIGDNLGIKTSEYIVTWKTQNGFRVDVAALKEAKLYEQFSTPSKARVLRIRKQR
jgi:putative phage-type endonuclease